MRFLKYIAGRNLNNQMTVLIADSEIKLHGLFDWVMEESEEKRLTINCKNKKSYDQQEKKNPKICVTNLRCQHQAGTEV